MERVRLTFVPSWDGPVEGWCVNYINKNVWRVVPEHDKDDLYQDAFVFFLVCKERYPEVSEPPHFMALMKTCLRNHINELATKRTKRQEIKNFSVVLDDDPDNVSGLLEQLGAVDPSTDEVDFNTMRRDAPTPFQRIAAAFTLGAVEYRVIGGIRETTAALLNRIAGTTDPYIVRKFKEWVRDGRIPHKLRIHETIDLNEAVTQ